MYDVTRKTLLLFALSSAALAAEPAEVKPVSFHRDIRPVLQRSCQGCHQPAKRGGDLSLTSFDEFKAGGSEGISFKEGAPADSLVIKYLTGEADPRMPKNADPLPPEQIELFKRWISEGAKDDSPASAKQTIDMEHPPVYEQAPVISALAYAPDGKTLAVSGYHETLIHSADGNALKARLVGLAQRINALAFTSDGKLLGVAGGSPGRFGEVQVWDPESKKLKLSITVGFDSVYGLSFAPDGARLAVGCSDNTARVFETKTGKETLVLKHHTDWVFGTVFTADNKFLVTVGRDRAAKLSEADTGSFIDDINKLKGPLKAISRHPTLDQFVIAGDDGVAEIYKMHRTQARIIGDDFNLLKSMERLPAPNPAHAVAFAPDGARIAVGGGGGEVRIHDAADGKRAATLTGHEGSIYAVTFSPDGKQLAAGGFDGKVRLYDIAAQKLVKDFIPVPLKDKEVAAGQTAK